ncbi:hypothetical protein SDC9_124914 [bioreactor metagenome]|uniref:Uncharacterized protein n=1 Tax=bioreactor metagenome TaxID=1076179 RepID=A0A645CLX4_9ZZZZ
MKFVGIQIDLREGCITKGQCLALINPCSCRFCSCNINLSLTRCGNGMTQLTNDIFVFQPINQPRVILFWNQVSTICINTFLQDIGYITEV